MWRSLSLLAVFVAIAYCCEDGVDNVIKVFDTTNGKGNVLFHDVEIWTYDKNKKPACTGKKPNFMLPGHFKVAKGKIEVREGVKDLESLKLSLSVEKQSWLVGVVCENGKSKNQFVPNELCEMDFCKLAGDICAKVTSKTPALDITMFTSGELIDIGPMPIPQLAGDWKISAKVLSGKKAAAGIRLGDKGSWLSIETEEGGDIKFEPAAPVGGHHDEF